MEKITMNMPLLFLFFRRPTPDACGDAYARALGMVLHLSLFTRKAVPSANQDLSADTEKSQEIPDLAQLCHEGGIIQRRRKKTQTYTKQISKLNSLSATTSSSLRKKKERKKALLLIWLVPLLKRPRHLYTFGTNRGKRTEKIQKNDEKKKKRKER